MESNYTFLGWFHIGIRLPWPSLWPVGQVGRMGPTPQSGETLTHMFVLSHADEWYLLTFPRRLNWVSMETKCP